MSETPFRPPGLEHLDEESIERLIAIDSLMRERGMPVDDLGRASRVNAWNGFIKNADDEPEKVVLAGIELRPSMEPDGWQAERARITPSRAKTAKRDHKLIVAFADAQIDYRRIIDGRTQEQTLQPIHSEPNLLAARSLIKFLKPDTIVDLGDMTDFAGISRFPSDSDHFFKTLGPSFQRYHDFLAGLRADNPETPIHAVDSNHNVRLKKAVLKYMPALHDLYQANASPDDYPVLTTPFLANFKHLGIEWHGGYGAARFIYGEEYDTPPIEFKHGDILRSNGSTAAAESKANPENHVVRGHGHRMERHTRTNRRGEPITAMQIGALCLSTGEVPGYHSGVDDKNRPVPIQENHQASVGVIEDYGGHYVFNDIPIINGIIRYRGREFNGNE